MALSILDGNQSATTLSTILSSGQHITAHTVVSLGTQAITDIVNATSANLTNTQLRASAVTVGGTVTVGNSLTISSLPAISGTVTINNFPSTQLVEVDGGAITIQNGIEEYISSFGSFPISGTVDIGNSVNVFGRRAVGQEALPLPVNSSGEDNSILGMPIGFNSTEGFALVSTSNPCPVSGAVTVGNTVTIAGTVTANTFAVQGTAVTTSNFTSTTASTVLASFNATREVLTIFNEGAGNLHICAGATCTTIAYQVRLSAGDYYEVPNHQTTITHSAVFATAGTARVTQVS